MAPEQARGDRSLDARADIYALGAMMYFALTGRPPFTGESAFAVMMAHARDPVVPAVGRATRRAATTSSEVVLRCLAKQPGGALPERQGPGRRPGRLRLGLRMGPGPVRCVVGLQGPAPGRGAGDGSRLTPGAGGDHRRHLAGHSPMLFRRRTERRSARSPPDVPDACRLAPLHMPSLPGPGPRPGGSSSASRATRSGCSTSATAATATPSRSTSPATAGS